MIVPDDQDTAHKHVFRRIDSPHLWYKAARIEDREIIDKWDLHGKVQYPEGEQPGYVHDYVYGGACLVHRGSWVIVNQDDGRVWALSNDEFLAHYEPLPKIDTEQEWT